MRVGWRVSAGAPRWAAAAGRWAVECCVALSERGEPLALTEHTTHRGRRHAPGQEPSRRITAAHGL